MTDKQPMSDGAAMFFAAYILLLVMLEFGWPQRAVVWIWRAL